MGIIYSYLNDNTSNTLNNIKETIINFDDSSSDEPYQNFDVIETRRKQTEYDYRFKIVVVGDKRVGKSTLISRYINKTFNDKYFETMCVDFGVITKIYNNKKLNVQVWDTTGDERYNNIIEGYLKHADMTIIVYDITNKQTTCRINKIVEYVKKEQLKTCFCIVGTKNDLEYSAINMFYSEIDEYAKKNNCNHITISSKNEEDVEKLFNNIYDQLLKKYYSEIAPPENLSLTWKETINYYVGYNLF